MSSLGDAAKNTASSRLIQRAPGQTVFKLPFEYKTTPFAGAVVFGAAATIKGVRTAKEIRNQRRVGRAEYVGNDPMTYYDATPNVDRKTGDKTLGATGELVFGLHRGRQG